MCTRLRVWLLQLSFFFSHLSIVPCLLLLFLFYYFRAFFFVYLFVSSSSSSSVIWFFYFSLCFFFSFCSLFCPVTTRSLFLFFLSLFWQNAFVRDRTPPVLPRNSPFLFSLSVALFRLPPVLPSHENYPETRESKRDREVRRGGI